MVVVVAASEALSIYTKSGPFVRGKELFGSGTSGTPQEAEAPPWPRRVVFNVLGSLQTSPDFRRLHEATNNIVTAVLHSKMA